MVYKYYNYTTNSGKTDKDDIEYLHVSTSPWTDNGNLEVQYTDNFDKVRSISAKQSNRFNILQTIAETFECWL
uniref:Minor structural protein n=1 Tax=Siphoviridae sp. ct2vX3 TaxID=2825318 RepID=A0A8S5PYV5_9CAUD|nr:MAG TPA: minor structural protein [Siphoviridae sp. ct2vX3]